MDDSNSPRILLSAYQCGPEMGSVSHIGWEWYSHLAKQVPVTLITHIRNRPTLLNAGAPLAHSQIIFIDTEWLADPLFNLVCKLFPKSEYAVSLFSSIDFYFYDWLAVKEVKKLQQTGSQWDIVHQVTPVSPKAATRLHTLGLPLVLGPWNGGLTIPLTFLKVVFQDLNWLYPLRYFANLIDWAWQSSRRAALILTATQATLQSIPKSFHSHCQPFLENGVNLELFTAAPWPAPPSTSESLRIVFVGRLMAFKGLPMLLQAVAQLKNYRPVQLTVVGSGPRELEWKTVAQQLGLDKEIVTWYGQASLSEVVKQIQDSHLLCLPSVRESGGSVLLEAMACARPVLAVDYGGPGELIDDSVGRVVSTARGAKGITEALIHCLNDIFEQPAQWQQRGLNGRQRVELLYSWEVKTEKMLACYRTVIEREGLSSVDITPRII